MVFFLHNLCLPFDHGGFWTEADGKERKRERGFGFFMGILGRGRRRGSEERQNKTNGTAGRQATGQSAVGALLLLVGLDFASGMVFSPILLPFFFPSPSSFLSFFHTQRKKTHEELKVVHIYTPPDRPWKFLFVFSLVSSGFVFV